MRNGPYQTKRKSARASSRRVGRRKERDEDALHERCDTQYACKDTAAQSLLLCRPEEQKDRGIGGQVRSARVPKDVQHQTRKKQRIFCEQRCIAAVMMVAV